MDTFTADDGEILDVLDEGEGPPVVLLHGWTASHEEWNLLAPGLARDHRVIRWNARGHGDRPLATATVPTVQRMARDLENLLDARGLARAAFVGHSMGVLTLWEYIRAHGTGRLARLCLIDQSPRLLTDAGWAGGVYGDFDAARGRRFVAELREDFAEAVLRLSAHGLNARARANYDRDSRGWRAAREALRRLRPGPLIATWESLAQADYRDVLPAIDVPTLLVYGAESNFYSLGTARYVQASIPGATLTVYEGADHSPHLAEPGRFERELRDFLA